MRLDPFYPAECESCLGAGLYLLGRYPEALASLGAATRRVPGIKMFLTWHAAAAAQMGQWEEAKAAVAGALNLEPDLTIAKWLNFIQFAKDEDSQRVADGLRKAGLPE
jgi:tetratricopeptide (TPR) repeat protein